MAYGIEIRFGFVGEETVLSVLKALGIEIDSFDDHYDTEDEEYEEMFYEKLDAFERPLEEAYEATLDALGWTWRREAEGLTVDYIVETPWGRREAQAFRLTLDIADEYERSDTVLAISLSSRYSPCLLDMSDPHGALDVYVFDEEAMNKIAIAKTEIIKRLPFMDKAIVFASHEHY